MSEIECLTMIDGQLVLLPPAPICRACFSANLHEVNGTKTLVTYCDHAGRGASLPLVFGMTWRIHPSITREEFFRQASSVGSALTPSCIN
jgi:hypothetical protein